MYDREYSREYSRESEYFNEMWIKLEFGYGTDPALDELYVQ